VRSGRRVERIDKRFMCFSFHWLWVLGLAWFGCCLFFVSRLRTHGLGRHRDRMEQNDEATRLLLFGKELGTVCKLNGRKDWAMGRSIRVGD
jgi:hypothetical protein